MRLPRFVIDNYTRALKGIDTKSAIAVSKMLANVDWSDKKASVDKVCEAMEQICQYSADSAAELAATFYDTLCAGATGEFAGAIADSARNQGHSIPYVEKAIEDSDGNIEELGRSLSGIASYGTKRAAGETVRRNARRLGHGYARVPGGTETCNFCIMLASRGLVWETEKSALSGKVGDGHYHENCQCAVVPVFDKGDVIEGFDYKKYLDMYENPENYPEIREARNARRRELRRERKEAVMKKELEQFDAIRTDEAKKIIGSKLFSEKVDSVTLDKVASHLDDAMTSGDKSRRNAAKVLSWSVDRLSALNVDKGARTSLFDHTDSSITLNSYGLTNPRTILHELFHLADHASNARYTALKIGKDGEASVEYDTSGNYSSLLFGNERISGGLSRLMHADKYGETRSWKDLKKRFAAKDDIDLYDAIKAEIEGINLRSSDIASLSDMINASSNGRISFGYYHPDYDDGTSYWNRATRVLELVADYGSSAVIGGPEFDLIRKLLPKETGLLDEMIEAISDGI